MHPINKCNTRLLNKPQVATKYSKMKLINYLPAAHMSKAVVCVLACSNSSGERYHKVTTPGVMGCNGKPYFLAVITI